MEFAVGGIAITPSENNHGSSNIRLPAIGGSGKRKTNSASLAPTNLLPRGGSNAGHPSSMAIVSSNAGTRRSRSTSLTAVNGGNVASSSADSESARNNNDNNGSTGLGIIARAASGGIFDAGKAELVPSAMAPNNAGGTSRDNRSAANGRQPTGMSRATEWTLDVENAFRFQSAGFRDREVIIKTCIQLWQHFQLSNPISIQEYIAVHGTPDIWEGEGGMIKCLKAKKTGYFLYFRKTRECEDKHLHRIKLYRY
jgi:hypothetical protein